MILRQYFQQTIVGLAQFGVVLKEGGREGGREGEREDIENEGRDGVYIT